MRTAFFFVFVWMVFAAKIYSQCSVTPWMTPTVLASDGTFGTYAFNTANNAATSDNQYAEAASIASLFSGNTQYLKATGFNFAIPVAATICGIEVQVERSAENIGLFTSVEDASIRLIKNGTITGSNKASGTNWTSSDATASYGGAADGWSTTLVPNDINDANFGVAVSAKINGLVSLFPLAKIDQVRMRVHYMVTLSLQEINFQVKEKRGNAIVTCSGDQLQAENIIVLQRSTDQVNWINVHTYTTSQKQWEDNNEKCGDYYYRLKVEELSGKIAYSMTRRISTCSTGSTTISNPVNDEINITSATSFRRIELLTIVGDRVAIRHLEEPSRQYKINTSTLQPGMYILKIDDKIYRVIKR